MMDDNVFGDYAKERDITIRPRKPDLISDDPPVIEVCFDDVFDGHTYMSIECY